MNYYKKAETRLKYDEARKQFVGELNVLRLQWNETKDYSILTLSPNGRGGWTPLRPLSGLQEIRVGALEESAVLCFPSRRGLTPRGSLECNPEILVFP